MWIQPASTASANPTMCRVPSTLATRWVSAFAVMS